MLTPNARLALAVVAFGVGAYLLVASDYVGVVFLGASAYFGHSYFRYGTVWLAFREVAHGHMDAAAKLLTKIQDPQTLGSEQRAYFELASGLVAASRAQNRQAEEHLRAALAHALRTENDRALAEAVLAQLLLARDQMAEARAIVEVAVTRDCRPAIAARLKGLHEQLRDDAPPRA